jgi:hypothetical protein
VAIVGGQRYASKPVYGLLNGFYLDRLRGEEHEITVIYAPQQRFRLGALVSAMAGGLVLAWLGYDIWRERAQRRRDR